MKEIKWINGIKILACVGVLCSHYVMMYTMENLNSVSGYVLAGCAFFRNGNFWMNIFLALLPTIPILKRAMEKVLKKIKRRVEA